MEEDQRADQDVDTASTYLMLAGTAALFAVPFAVGAVYVKLRDVAVSAQRAVMSSRTRLHHWRAGTVPPGA